MYEIYRAHPEVRNCIANDQIICKHFNGDTINLKDFDTDRAYGAMSGLALWSDEEKRSWLKKQIRSLLPGSPELKESELRRYDAKAQHTGKYLVSTESMERKLENLRIGKDHEEKSVEELTAEVASQRTITGYPPVPATITKMQLRMMSVAELKKAIQQFGLRQINQRLAEAD